MAAGKMLCLLQNFSALSTRTTAWNTCQRFVSNKSLLEKLGLPEKPRKPLTPYIAYISNIRPELQKKYPEIKQSEVVKMAAQMWRNADENEKKKLLENFKNEFKEYKLKLKNYDMSLSTTQKMEIKEAEADIKALKDQKLMKRIKSQREKQLQRPKKPGSSFLRFSLENFNNDVSRKEHMKNMGRMWKKLEDSVKEKYRTEQQKKMETYKKELELWEEEMIRLGNVDVVRSKTLKEKLKVFS